MFLKPYFQPAYFEPAYFPPIQEDETATAGRAPGFVSHVAPPERIDMIQRDDDDILLIVSAFLQRVWNR